MTLRDIPPRDAKAIRILQVISHFELGGAEKCTFELLRLLDSRAEMGVAAVLGDDSSEMGRDLTRAAREKGVAIFNGVGLPWKKGGFLAAAWRLRRVVREFRPDIVHLNTELPEFTYVLSLFIDKSLRNIPVIRTIHNTVLWSRWKRLGAWCERKLADTAVVYVSESVRDCFMKWRSDCGLKPVSRHLTIYNPIVVPLIRARLLNRRVQERNIRLLFAGRFEFQKGCDLLPEILRRVTVPENTQLSLSIYGQGSDEEVLKALQSSPPRCWNIQIAPPTSNLLELLPDFDILLFPSRFEGYGRLAAEAVLVGIPVVAFRLPVLLEIFPSSYPWLVPFDDQDVSGFADVISSLLTSFEGAQIVVDKAKKMLSTKLDPGKTALAYLTFYEQLVYSEKEEKMRSSAL